MNLQHRDWKIIGFLIAAWIIAAFLGGSLDIIQYGMAAELPFDIVTGILGLGAVFYAWQIITHERHKIGRPLTYIGIGTGGFGLTLAPHIWMHMNMPQLFGFFGWSHTVTLWSFLLITYGYYLLTEVRGGTFDRRDWLVITGSFLISIVAGGVASGRSAAFALRIEQWTALVNVPVFLAALYFITSFSDEWKGEIARGLQLAGLGLILQILLWIPHILWHTVAMPQNFAPSMLGITASWWLAFFHFSTVASMVLVVHGFRILHSEFA